VEGRSGPFPNDRAGGIRAADRVVDGRALGDVDDAYRRWNLVLLRPLGEALPVPTLHGEQEVVPDVGTQAELVREELRNLAHGDDALLEDLPRARHLGELAGRADKAVRADEMAQRERGHRAGRG